MYLHIILNSWPHLTPFGRTWKLSSVDERRQDHSSSARLQSYRRL